MIQLPKTLFAPEHPVNLPDSAIWLAGEGAGSWFVIEKTVTEYIYNISRYSPEGTIECQSLFQSDSLLSFEIDYEITYPSHCSKVTIIQNDIIINFKSIK